MKKTRRFSTPTQLMLTALIAVVLYCFWIILYPFVITGREQSQLFLLDCGYFTERIIVPGGFAQYVGEFLTQFFITPYYGAIVYVILFILAQWLSCKLLQRWFPEKNNFFFYLASLVLPLFLCYLWLCQYVPLTPSIAILLTMAVMVVLPRKKSHRLVCMAVLIPIGYWLVGPAIALMLLCYPIWSMCCGALLLVLCIFGSWWISPYSLGQLARGVDYYWEKTSLGTLEDMEYDMLTRLKKWGSVTKKYQEHPTQSPAIQTATAMALYQTGHVGKDELLQSINISNEAYQNQSSAFTMSDVYMHIGMVAMAQRAAFEAMESVPNHNKSGRALRRLVETNLITGEAEVAKKYINILDKTLFYSGWANMMRPLADNPKLVDKHPSLGKLRKIYNQTADSFFY